MDVDKISLLPTQGRQTTALATVASTSSQKAPDILLPQPPFCCPRIRTVVAGTLTRSQNAIWDFVKLNSHANLFNRNTQKHATDLPLYCHLHNTKRIIRLEERVNGARSLVRYFIRKPYLPNGETKFLEIDAEVVDRGVWGRMPDPLRWECEEHGAQGRSWVACALKKRLQRLWVVPDIREGPKIITHTLKRRRESVSSPDMDERRRVTRALKKRRQGSLSDSEIKERSASTAAEMTTMFTKEDSSKANSSGQGIGSRNIVKGQKNS